MPTDQHSKPHPLTVARRRGALMLAIALTAAGPSTAVLQGVAEPSTPENLLDLDACVRIAIDENPLLRAAQEGVTAARETIGIARASRYPEVGLAAGYRRFDSHLFFPAEVSLQDSNLGTTDDWSSDVTVGYTLYDHGQRRAEQGAAAATLTAVEQDAERVRQDVVFAVHERYYRVLSALAAESVARTRVARSTDHFELASARKQAGAAPRSDVLRAQVEVADAELALVQASGGVRVAYGGLKTAMGLPVGLPIHVQPPEEEARSLSVPEAEAALARALRQRPELEAARERITAATEEVTAIKGIYGPRVRAEGAFGWRDSEFLPQDQNWAAGISLRVPLFTGFAKSHRLARADAGVRALEAEATALADRIQLEVWTALSDLGQARQSVLQSEVLRAVAEESLEFVRARYEVSASTIADLLDAEAALNEADSAHVSAVFGYQLAKARLLRAEGDL